MFCSDTSCCFVVCVNCDNECNALLMLIELLLMVLNAFSNDLLCSFDASKRVDNCVVCVDCSCTVCVKVDIAFLSFVISSS